MMLVLGSHVGSSYPVHFTRYCRPLPLGLCPIILSTSYSGLFLCSFCGAGSGDLVSSCTVGRKGGDRMSVLVMSFMIGLISGVLTEGVVILLLIQFFNLLSFP